MPIDYHRLESNAQALSRPVQRDADRADSHVQFRGYFLVR